MKSLLALTVIAGAAASANAAIVGTALGTGAPPATLGGYTMTAFPSDGTGGYAQLSSLASPRGGSVGFSPDVYAADIGSGWATWSGGGTYGGGDVYWSGGATTLAMTLPAGTYGFAFYAEPNPFAVYTITATDNEGNSVSQDVDGSAGAAGWHAYTDGGSALTSITVTSAVDFAVGEFYIAIPAPASLSLLGLGALVAGRRRR